MKKPNIRKILVPVDFSQLSLEAIEKAKALGQTFGARIYLLHVSTPISPVGLAMPAQAIPDTLPLENETGKELLRRLRSIAARFEVSPGDCHVMAGSPVFEMIGKAARAWSIDLIVMPTHGMSALQHVLLGSTAERVMQHSLCPVFIVRRSSEQIREIVVPVDFSDSSMSALLYAITLAKTMAAKVIVFHAVYLGYAYTSDGYAMYDLAEITKAARKSAEQAMARFMRGVKFEGVEFETVVRTGNATEETCRFAKEQNADLIVMATHGRTGLAHVLMGSVAEKVTRQADRPVLVIPTRQRVKRPANPRKPIVCGIRARKGTKPVALARSRREPLKGRDNIHPAYPGPCLPIR